MCTFKKAIKNVEVKVDVQKGALGFKVFLTIGVLIPSNFVRSCHMVIVLNDYLVHSWWG